MLTKIFQWYFTPKTFIKKKPFQLNNKKPVKCESYSREDDFVPFWFGRGSALVGCMTIISRL